MSPSALGIWSTETSYEFVSTVDDGYAFSIPASSLVVFSFVSSFSSLGFCSSFYELLASIKSGLGAEACSRMSVSRFAIPRELI